MGSLTYLLINKKINNYPSLNNDFNFDLFVRKECMISCVMYESDGSHIFYFFIFIFILELDRTSPHLFPFTLGKKDQDVLHKIMFRGRRSVRSFIFVFPLPVLTC